MARNSKSTVSELDTNNVQTTDATAAENAEAENPEVKKVKYEGVTSFVYAGPTLPGGRLKKYTVLSGTYAEITEYYKEAIALYPSVERLIIPAARFAEARDKTQVSGNILYNYYQEIAAAIQAKGDEK